MHGNSKIGLIYPRRCWNIKFTCIDLKCTIVVYGPQMYDRRNLWWCSEPQNYLKIMSVSGDFYFYESANNYSLIQ